MLNFFCHCTDGNCTLKSGVLSSILKIPSYPSSMKRKPKNPKRLDLHGKCFTSQEFTLNRLKAAKEEEDIFYEKEEKKKRRTELAKAKKEAKIQQQLEKKLATKAKKTITKPHELSMPTKKGATFVPPIVKSNVHN